MCKLAQRLALLCPDYGSVVGGRQKYVNLNKHKNYHLILSNASVSYPKLYLSSPAIS